jgi:hypothetical protein
MPSVWRSCPEQGGGGSRTWWGSVASNMEQAVEQLEGVIGQLGTAEPSGRNAAAVLDQITDRRPTVAGCHVRQW